MSKISSQNRCFTKFTSSFVDESLFGARKTTTEPEVKPYEFDPPWISEEDRNIKRNKPLLFYCPSIATSNSSAKKSSTTANEREILITSLKSKSRPSSARNNKQRMRFSASYVDESLFKSTRQNNETPLNFEPPWVTNQDKKPKPILWDYSGYTAGSLCSQRQRDRPSTSGTTRTESAKSTSGRDKNVRTERMGKDNRRPWR